MNNSILNIAKEESFMSPMICHYGSTIMKGGKPIISGHNHYRSCYRLGTGRYFFTMFHAERDTLIKFIKRCFRGKKLTHRKMKKYNIFVTRTKERDGVITYMKGEPCQECVKMLQRFGISKAKYTDENGKLVTVKISHLNPEDHYLSYAQKDFMQEHKDIIRKRRV